MGIGCPNDDTIAKLVCRRLDASELAAVEAHIADCAACRQLVGTLAAASLPAFGPTSATEVVPPTRAGTARYVIEKELARGGMGRISIAEDTQLGRRVAIKELRSTGLALEARFRRELALTSRLQHPSIVSIYDSGTWDSGEPFYVMRLVSGEPLDRAIARHRDVAGRLALLPHGIAIADAIAYAHVERIIHRDIKPSNVLVGAFGETVVIDWGLAKDLGSADVAPESGALDSPEGTETMLGLVLGTPAYMAPEQARGQTLDERVDVYALGAVLYHLLAGVPPHQGGSTEEILQAVRTTTPRALSEIEPSLPPDLIAIIDKAMARRPEDRYPSARELTADLKRFQAGQLVAAHRYSSWQLARRWIQRHRTAVAVGVVAAVVVVGVVGLAFLRVLAAQELAERRRADAQELARFMSTDLHDRLKTIGKLDLLGAVADKERAYYDAHAEDQRAADRYDRVIALRNVAEVLQARYDDAGAYDTYRAALAIAQTLPDEPAYRPAVSSSQIGIGDVLRQRGETERALAEYRAAAAIDGQRGPRDDSQLEPDDAAVVGRLRIGSVLEERGDTTAALEQFRAALALAMRSAVRSRKSKPWQRTIDECHLQIGRTLMMRGDPEGASAEIRTALASEEKLAAQDPDDADVQSMLVTLHTDPALTDSIDARSALDDSRLGLALAEQLVMRDPTNGDWQRNYLEAQITVSQAQINLGDSNKALELARVVVERMERAVTASPDRERHQYGLVAARMNLGQILELRDERSAAFVQLEAAVTVAENRLALHPTIAALQREVSAAHIELGHVLLADETTTRAAQTEFRRALEVLQRLFDRDPADLTLARQVLEVSTDIGDTLMMLDDPKAALGAYRQSIDKTNLGRIYDRHHDNDVAIWVATNHAKIGNALVASGTPEQGVTEYQQALAIANQHDTASLTWQLRLFETYLGLGDARHALHEEAEALKQYRAGLASATWLAAHDPGNRVWEADAALARARIAGAGKNLE